MIDILNNPNKHFKLIKDLPGSFFHLKQIPAGLFLKPSRVELGANSSTIFFLLSSDNNIIPFEEKYNEICLEETKARQERRKNIYNEMIKYWDETPEIFSFKTNNYLDYKVYSCLNESPLYDRDTYMLLATGNGSNTYYEKQYYIDELKKFDKTCADEIKSDIKRRKNYTKALLRLEYQIDSDSVDKFLIMEEPGSKKETTPKEKFPFVFQGSFLNRMLYSISGDLCEIDDELIEEFKNDEDLPEKYKTNIIEYLEKLKGYTIECSHEGDHYHDGQVCDYTVTLTSPSGHEYHAHNNHSLVTGWNFTGNVEFI